MDRLENLLGVWALTVADRLGRGGDDDASRPLSPADRAALVTLLAHPDRPVAALCEPAGLSASGATRLVDRLAADGWVSRTPGENARERRVRLTTAGERVARHLLEARADVLGHATAGLAPAERAVLETAVERLLGDLVDTRTEAWRSCRLCDRSACRSGGPCPLDLTEETA